MTFCVKIMIFLFLFNNHDIVYKIYDLPTHFFFFMQQKWASIGPDYAGGENILTSYCQFFIVCPYILERLSLFAIYP